MKAIAEKGRFTLPREIFEKNNLPLRGEYEVEVVNRRIQLSPPIEPPWRILKSLEEPPQIVPIDEMVKAEMVDVD